MLDELRQGSEGQGRGDVKPSTVQAADLVVFHNVPVFIGRVSDGQGKGS